MGSQNSLQELALEIRSHSAVVVVSHYSPDPDAYGSSCGLTLALQAAGKKVVCVNEDGAAERLDFIPGVRGVQADFPPDFAQLLIAVDCGDARRVGDRLSPGMRKFPRIINIDHHASNDFFGHLNFVDPHASSTSELILRLLEEMEVPISAEVATCLFAGLSADTGSFKHSSTSAEAFAVAGRLVSCGAVPWAIAQQLYSNNKLSTLKLQAEAIAAMTLCGNGEVAEVVVTTEMARRLGADPEETDELKQVAQSVKGVKASVVIREAADLWRVSLRSREPRYDIASVAEKFGGGGHKCAAAFRWRRSLDELRAKLRPMLEAVVRDGAGC
ncbi:MAG: bifunctional oligoribonuclease/PAP phosphatase NrnA [Proteobacteria bacterium]|nr:bifunctional oligoribonuclease/PAP phosphatase NrnA [Pseudomonadota bacterium]